MLARLVRLRLRTTFCHAYFRQCNPIGGPHACSDVTGLTPTGLDHGGRKDKNCLKIGISGGGDVLGFIVAQWNKERTAPLQHLPFWVFHGARDTVVPVSEDIRMVDALKKFGNTDVKMTIYPEAQHDAWTETYNNPELYRWFLQNHLTE